MWRGRPGRGCALVVLYQPRALVLLYVRVLVRFERNVDRVGFGVHVDVVVVSAFPGLVGMRVRQVREDPVNLHATQTSSHAIIRALAAFAINVVVVDLSRLERARALLFTIRAEEDVLAIGLGSNPRARHELLFVGLARDGGEQRGDGEKRDARRCHGWVRSGRRGSCVSVWSDPR